MADVKVLMIENGPLKVIGGVAFVDDATGDSVAGADAETIAVPAVAAADAQ